MASGLTTKLPYTHTTFFPDEKSAHYDKSIFQWKTGSMTSISTVAFIFSNSDSKAKEVTAVGSCLESYVERLLLECNQCLFVFTSDYSNDGSCPRCGSKKVVEKFRFIEGK